MKSSRQSLEEFSLESFLSTAGIAESEFSPHLDLRSLLRLSQTNRGIHGLFEKGHCREALLDALMRNLAHIIVNEPTGKNITTLILILTNILNIFPELLTRKINKVVFEETGQAYINYSLLQLAFAEYDDELCCDAFEPFFERVFGSKDAVKEEIRKQLDEKFPEESEEEKQQKEAKEKNQLAALLTPIKQAITSEQFNNGDDDEGKMKLSIATHADIETYRNAFDELQPKEIHKGRRSSLNIPQIIYDDYAQTAQQWQYDYERCALYEDAVVSQAQRYKPKNVAMGYAQGLYYLQDRSEAFARDSTLREGALPRLNFYACLRQMSSDFSALVGSCVNIVGGGRRGGMGCGGGALSKLMSNKNSKLAELTRPDKEYPAARPIIY